MREVVATVADWCWSWRDAVVDDAVCSHPVVIGLTIAIESRSRALIRQIPGVAIIDRAMITFCGLVYHDRPAIARFRQSDRPASRYLRAWNRCASSRTSTTPTPGIQSREQSQVVLSGKLTTIALRSLDGGIAPSMMACLLGLSIQLSFVQQVIRTVQLQSGFSEPLGKWQRRSDCPDDNLLRCVGDNKPADQMPVSTRRRVAMLPSKVRGGALGPGVGVGVAVGVGPGVGVGGGVLGPGVGVGVAVGAGVAVGVGVGGGAPSNSNAPMSLVPARA